MGSPLGIIPGHVENDIVSGMDWFPTFVAAAGYEGHIAAELRYGKRIKGKNSLGPQTRSGGNRLSAAEVGHDEADARKQLALVPLDLRVRQPVFPSFSNATMISFTLMPGITP